MRTALRAATLLIEFVISKLWLKVFGHLQHENYLKTGLTREVAEV
jgi:hypothetical protein